MRRILFLLTVLNFSFVLTGCFSGNDVKWDFKEDEYVHPVYYTIIYGTEYEGIESLRISEESIVGVNHYFDGFYLIEGNPNVFYHWKDSFLYEITVVSNDYICSLIDEYDENVHVDVSKFEEDLHTSTYMTKGDFPYRYTVSVGENDPFIEFHNKSFPYIDFDYHLTGDIFYYSVKYTSVSSYETPEIEESCFTN